MALDDLNQKVTQLRDQAKTIRKNLLTRFAEIDADTRLSTAGKLAAKREAAAPVAPQLAALRQQEERAIEDRLEQINRTLGGYSGSDPTAIIAFRDAQDRAEAIIDAQGAMKILDRARASGDTVLAAAIMRRAMGEGLAQGWRDVVKRYGDQYPQTGELLADLRELEKFKTNTLGRTSAYLNVGTI